MRLECDTFYFYPNGEYKTFSEWDNRLDCYINDIQEVSRAIRIFGTRKEINEALNSYCEMSGLNLDEGYDFTDKDKLKEYKEHYKNKPLIINLKQ
jgi:hypothetical protein|tara:strand:- start:175 stop:459 length:285 start_codon:yes stop_codon:yes gene_type:complete